MPFCDGILRGFKASQILREICYQFATKLCVSTLIRRKFAWENSEAKPSQSLCICDGFAAIVKWRCKTVANITTALRGKIFCNKSDKLASVCDENKIATLLRRKIFQHVFMILTCLWVHDVKGNRSYTDKFEPFVLASQAEQVVFIPYPRTRGRRDQDWLSVIKVNPRGRIVGGLAVDADDDQPPVQPARTEEVSIPKEVTTDLTRLDSMHSGLDVIFEDSEGNGDEFDEEEEEDEEDDDDDELEEGGVESYLSDHDDEE